MTAAVAHQALLRALDPPPAGLASRLAPTGTLRAGINLSNGLLVSSCDAGGGPVGVSPDMASAIASHLQVALQLVPYPSPGALADAATRDEWDIALLGAEPQRAETISFTQAYCEIEATCIVRDGSSVRDNGAIDAPGLTIALAPRTAWGLWLDRNIRHATLVKAETYEEARALFLERRLDVLGGLRPKLIEDVATMPGTRVLDGRYTAVQQAIGVPRLKGDDLATAATRYLQDFARVSVVSGFVAALIGAHGVNGLSVAVAPSA